MKTVKHELNRYSVEYWEKFVNWSPAASRFIQSKMMLSLPSDEARKWVILESNSIMNYTGQNWSSAMSEAVQAYARKAGA